MSHPNPSHDRENEYPDDNYKPVRGKHGDDKKKAVARKMSAVDKLKMLVSNSEKFRKHPFNFKRDLWFKKGQGGYGDLPPGEHDKY